MFMFGIISIMLEGNDIYITQNKIDSLSEEKKTELKDLMLSLLERLN